MKSMTLRTLLVLFLGLQGNFFYASESDGRLDASPNSIAQGIEKSKCSKSALYVKEDRLRHPERYRGYGRYHHSAMLGASTVTEKQFVQSSPDDKNEILRRLEQFRKLRVRKASILNGQKSNDIIMNKLNAPNVSSVERDTLLLEPCFIQLSPSEKQIVLNDFESLRKFKVIHEAIQTVNPNNPRLFKVSLGLNEPCERLNVPGRFTSSSSVEDDPIDYLACLAVAASSKRKYRFL